jgi:hypothetical protein
MIWAGVHFGLSASSFGHVGHLGRHLLADDGTRQVVNGS